MIEIGKYRHYVTVQQATVSSTAAGNALTWAALQSVWAEIEPLSMNETLRGMQVDNRLTHRVRIRGLSTVTAKMRILFGSRHLYIRSILRRDERSEAIELLCEEEAV